VTRRRRLIVALLAAGLGAVIVPLALGAFLYTDMGNQPVRTPELRILEPTGVVHPGEPIPVRVAFTDFDFRPDLRCGPAGPCTGSEPQTLGPGGVAQGHIHVYIQKGTGLGDPDSVSFCIPPTAVEGVAVGTCPAIAERGKYRVSAEFQSNSHVSVLKGANRPQDAPTSDAVVIRVA
jgi:hypothetical protein